MRGEIRFIRVFQDLTLYSLMWMMGAWHWEKLDLWIYLVILNPDDYPILFSLTKKKNYFKQGYAFGNYIFILPSAFYQLLPFACPFFRCFLFTISFQTYSLWVSLLQNIFVGCSLLPRPWDLSDMVLTALLKGQYLSTHYEICCGFVFPHIMLYKEKLCFGVLMLICH